MPFHPGNGKVQKILTAVEMTGIAVLKPEVQGCVPSCDRYWKHDRKITDGERGTEEMRDERIAVSRRTVR